MKELQEEFTGKGQVRGFEFTQIKKTEYAYIYNVDTGVSEHYEVFERRENTQFKCVSYPSNKAFGLWAKTTSNYEYALELMEMFHCRILLRNESNKINLVY